MTIAIIGLILFFVAGAASVVAIGLRHVPQPAPAAGPNPRSPRLHLRPVIPAPPPVKRKRYIRRTPTDRRAEDALIRAGLAAGVQPADIARMLRGNPDYNRRRVAALARTA